MKSYFLRYLGIALIGLSTVACERSQSVNVNQDTVYGSYRLVYEAEDGKTYARATFRFDGPTGNILELSSPAEVLVDSMPMTWRPILGYYEADYAGPQPTAEFAYQDLDGNTYLNQAELADSIAFAPNLDSISTGGAFTLAWAGAPIEAGETVIVTISTGLGEDETKVFSTSDVGAMNIILPADRLGEIPNGEASIFLERRRDQILDQGTGAGGAVWSRYVSASQRVQLID